MKRLGRLSWRALEARLAPDPALSLEQQFFQALCLLGGLLSIFVIVPINQFQHLSPWVDGVVLAFGLVSLAFAWAARRGHYFKKAMLFSIIVCLDLIWFPNGGSLGSIGLYFFTAALFLVLFFEGIFRFVMLAVLLADIIGLHLVEQAWPRLVHPFQGSGARLLDLSTGYTTSMAICALMLGVILAGAKRERAKLAESERMYRELLECQGEGFSVVDDQERFLVVNRVAEEIFGVAPGQLLGRTVTEFLPEDQQEVLRSETRLRAQGFASTYEVQIRREDGSPRTLLITATPRTSQDGGDLQAIGVFRDITERKRAEEELRRSDEALQRQNEIFASLLGIIPLGVCMVEAGSGRPLVANEAARRLLGREVLPQVSEHSLSEIYPACKWGSGDPYPLEERPLLRGMKGHSSHVEDMVILRPDGTRVLLEIFGTPVLDEEGRVWASLVSFFDITERKRAEGERAQIEAQNHQLQKAESLGRMAGSIAHHFNNKLQSVMGNLELMSVLPEGMDPARHLAQAKLATEKAAEMSRLLLLYLGQTPGKGEPRYLAEICHDSLTLLRGALPPSVTLETDCPSPGPVIHAVADQLQQVISNLVVNAYESMGEAGGSIRLSLGTCPASEIPIRRRFPIGWQASGGEYACLEVADTGCGIAEADMEMLFDPFFSTKFSGRGLGLPVLLGIIQSLGGAVTVESHPGHGSAFRIYLPTSTDLASSLPAASSQTPELQGGGTILLVDDDETLLESTGALIEMMGFELATAKDGAEALEVFRQRAGDIRCVITDLTMPRMDGWETLTALRQLDPTLPVIMASGYDKGSVMSGTQADRPHVFLEKPFGLQDLCQAIGQAMVISGRERS